MKKSYKISHIILAVMAFIIFNIMFIYEDISWKFLALVFTIIAFGASFPSAVISKKLINIGNKIQSKLLKICYYAIALPIISLVIFGVVCGIMYFCYENMSKPDEFGAALGQALTFLFLAISVFICIMLPYMQTVIVLILNHFIKSEK